MPYYEDLSPYEYTSHGQRCANLVNIGWLDLKRPFHQGSVEPALLVRIGELCMAPVNRTRGFHACSKRPEYPVREDVGGAVVALGSAEIRVFGTSKTYACPTLIYHYIREHRYLPPHEFLDAVSHLQP